MRASDWVLQNWERILSRLPQDRVGVLGISGAQGSGKSWLARLIAARHPGNVALFSLDDFYLTLKQRAALAADLHPNLRTRGVPGTHDVALLQATLDLARNPRGRDGLIWPRFDKISDDRLPQNAWSMATPPFDLILLEGWCVGAPLQSADRLRSPINAFEAQSDPDGTWRAYVNDQLAGPYRQLFKTLDASIFLKAPGFETVHAWRLEQELATYDAQGKVPPETLPSDILSFIQSYQRITQHMLEVDFADIVIPLDQARQVIL